MSQQTSLFGEVKTLYYCIHCNYVGYEIIKEGENTCCPKCDWVVYSEQKAYDWFISSGSNVYPKLIENWNRRHKYAKC